MEPGQAGLQAWRAACRVLKGRGRKSVSGGVSRDPSGAQFPPALDTPAVNLLGREVRLRHPLHPPGTDTLWVEGGCSALVVDGSVGSGRGQVPAEALGGGRGHLGSLGIQIGEWGLGAEIGLGRGPNQPGTGVEHLLCARPWVTAWHSLDAVLGAACTPHSHPLPLPLIGWPATPVPQLSHPARRAAP